MISTILLIFITLLFPPATVAIVAGCGADLFINILLTVLGYFPGHIHAFYVLYVYYSRRDQARTGVYAPPAPGVYSDRVQAGGKDHYAATAGAPPPLLPQHHQEQHPQQQHPQQAGYGTMPPPPQV